MKTLALANQKGGVGKSAVACQFAHFLAAKGKRVLFVDLDHQRNSSRALAMNPKVTVAQFTTVELLEASALPTSPDASFVLVPGAELLSGLERRVDQHNGFTNNLQDFLEAATSSFDYCVIDTNPNPDIRYAMALVLSQYVLSPVELNQEAIEGIRGFLGHAKYGLHNIQNKFNPELKLIGLLPNMVEPTPFQRKNFVALIQEHSKLLISTGPAAHEFASIPVRTAIAEAQADGVYLGDMRKTSARDAMREVNISFDAIERYMTKESGNGKT